MASESLIFPNSENLWGQTITINAATGLSEKITTQGQALVGILMPAAWTAANIGFNVSVDNVTYRTAYDNTGNLEQSVGTADAFICIPQGDTVFAPFMQLKSVDNANVAVAQGANRALTLVFRRYLGGS